MKKCTTCNRTFTDDSLSYCLDDGMPLESVAAGGAGSYDLGATMQYTPTPQQPPSFNQGQFSGQQSQQQGWAPTPPVGGMHAQPPKKKSKALFWIIGGIAALLVVGIAVTAIVIVMVGMSDSNSNNKNDNVANTNENRNDNSNANSNANNSNSNSNSNTSASKTFIAQDDFSSVRWWTGSNTYGKAEYVNGEYRLGTGAEGGYVAVYGPANFLSVDANTSVTTRSVAGSSPANGYGLAVFGKLKAGQLDDFAFVIRTDDNAAYRVVSHKNGAETVLVDWTPATQIRRGSATNQLEVRVADSKCSFYINGVFVTSVPDTAGDKTGVAGFYTSGPSPIAFDDLDVYR